MTQRRIYQEEYPYFVTVRTRENIPLFNKTVYAELLSREIFVSSDIKHFDILAYQIMPDHVHILTYTRTLEKVRSEDDINNRFYINTERTLSSVRSQNNISDLLQSIKGNFSWKIYQGNIWQRRFYARIVNTSKYLETVIKYIRQNPIKNKLPPKYHKWPYQYFNHELLDRL